MQRNSNVLIAHYGWKFNFDCNRWLKGLNWDVNRYFTVTGGEGGGGYRVQKE